MRTRPVVNYLCQGLTALIMICSSAQAFDLKFDSGDFQRTPVFSDVTAFDFRITVDADLAPGVYNNPPLIEVSYRVAGTLVPGTPSDFPAFALERIIDGTEFYAQGSSLSFEISPTAVLSDGLQVAELVGAGVVFTFNGREIDTGRFHPALLELLADGTGRIQNSNNVPSLNPLQEVDFGEEYITDLAFDPGNLTLVRKRGGGGSSALTPLALAWLASVLLLRPRSWRPQR
jgi:hypothetical protein